MAMRYAVHIERNTGGKVTQERFVMEAKSRGDANRSAYEQAVLKSGAVRVASVLPTDQPVTEKPPEKKNPLLRRKPKK